jgi:beta-lactamase regulating signal transducer with metallopeptidase domain
VQIHSFLTGILRTLGEVLPTIASPLLAVLFDAAVKGTAILLLAAVAALLMRRASAAARHWVWFLGVASLLVLPILSAALPGWYVLPPLPRRASGLAALAQSQMVVQTPNSPNFEERVPTSDFVETPLASPPVPQTISIPEVNSIAAYPTSPSPVIPSQKVDSLQPRHLDWASWALVLWFVGCLAQLAYIAMGFASLCWLGRRSSRITDGNWASLLDDLRKHLRLRRRVTLLGNGGRTMPMTWGLWKVRVLLPEDSADWNAEQRKAVLLHELAHAKRWDCLTQLVAQSACAIYWFNPLAWFAWKRMQSERERACDDLVLSAGAKASDYAEQLLRVAAEMPAVGFATAAIAMARPSKLEGRLLAILDVKRDRRAMTWSVAILIILLVAALAVPLAMVRAENAGDGGAATAPSAATQTTQKESEARAAIIARVEALQNLSVDFDEVEQYQPRYGLPARDPRQSHQTFSFLHGNAKWDFALDPQSIELSDRFVSHSITYRNGHVELLDRMRDPSKSYSYVGDTLTNMEMPVLEAGLGLSEGIEHITDWMTPEKISGMTLTFDQANRPTLTQVWPHGKSSWTFAPDHGYALVKCSGVSHFGEIVADDFRMVNGIAMPFSFTQKIILGDGTEDRRWTVTVKSYTINDPQNTPDRYWLKWPKGTGVDNQRAGIYVRTTADGQILNDKTLASLPVVGVHPLPVGLTKLPKPIEQTKAKEIPTGFELNDPSVELSDPTIVGPIKLPQSQVKGMPTPFGLGGSSLHLADPQSQGAARAGDRTPTSQPAAATQASTKFEGSPAGHVDRSQDAMVARLQADLGLRAPTETVTQSRQVHLYLKAPSAEPANAPNVGLVNPPTAFKLGDAADSSAIGPDLSLVPAGATLAFNAPSTSVAPTTSAASPWRVRLDCGATVEVLGVCRDPSVDQQWWRPDGSPLEHAPTRSPSMRRSVERQQRVSAWPPGYYFAIWVSDGPWSQRPDDGEIVMRANAKPLSEGNTAQIWGEYSGKPPADGKAEFELLTAVQKFLPEKDHGTIKLGIGAGPWDVVQEDDLNGGNGALAVHGAHGSNQDVWFDDAHEGTPQNTDVNAKAVFISAAHNISPDFQVRLIAVLNDGKELVGHLHRDTPPGDLQHITEEFRDVSIKDIKAFRLESRPFQWAEFKDISLKPVGSR